MFVQFVAVLLPEPLDAVVAQSLQSEDNPWLIVVYDNTDLPWFPAIPETLEDEQVNEPVE